MPRARPASLTTEKGLEVVLREPKAGDAKALMVFINPIMKESLSGLPITKRMTLKAEEMWLKDRLAEIRRRECVILLAERDGAVVGSCHLWRSKDKQSHRAFIGIALSKSVRGRGLGRPLMTRAIALAKDRMPEMRMVALNVFDYNDRARSLYDRMGFIEVGRVPGAVKEGDRYYDEAIMVLRL
jgi:RimJ/RimL family protein N-acetyltransferase